MLQELTLESLRNLDFGKVDVAFKRHLKRVVTDCLDRPGDESPREVALAFKVKPQRDQSGQADRVLLVCQVTSKVPAHRSAVFQCQPKSTGHLLFQSDDPGNVDQRSFDDLKQETQNGAE